MRRGRDAARARQPSRNASRYLPTVVTRDIALFTRDFACSMALPRMFLDLRLSSEDPAFFLLPSWPLLRHVCVGGRRVRLALEPTRTTAPALHTSLSR